MVDRSKILSLQIEAVQVASYCKIITDILSKFKTLSIIKIAVFSFIIKKQLILQVECYNGKNTTDLVLKALSQISGRHEELYNQLPFAFQALDLLIKNNICSVHQSEIIYNRPVGVNTPQLDAFIVSAIGESYTYTDRQFLKEVISVV